MPRRILIDGDIYAYRTAIQNEVATDWGEDFWTLHADAMQSKRLLDDTIEEIKNNLGGDEVVVALTDSKNFRKDVLPSYKSNRKNLRKPMILAELRQHLIDNHNTVIYPNLEADDVLGILATTPHEDNEDIIVSVDKDLRQIPTRVSPDGKDVWSVSKQEGDYWFMIQALTGDATDGYTGLPKVGIKTAEKILGTSGNTLSEMWQQVCAAYNKAGYSNDEALQQARCAYILRHGDYNLKTGKVKLWQTK
tara:strand:- start:10399 stop:11145 length:747 start_codon:yes stop_codon:yes gene_type:complete